MDSIILPIYKPLLSLQLKAYILSHMRVGKFKEGIQNIRRTLHNSRVQSLPTQKKSTRSYFQLFFAIIP